MRHLYDSIDVSDHVQGVEGGRESAVQAENLILHHSRQRKVVEEISQVFPHIRVAVLAEALIVEAIDLRDLSALVVASQDRDSVLEAHFQADQQRHSLYAIVASIDVIAHEQVVRIRWASTDLKQLHKVVELSMHVTADRDGTLDRLHVHLGLQDLFRL